MPVYTRVKSTLGQENKLEDTETLAAPLKAPKDVRIITSLMYLSALCGFLFPFANIIIPLIIWVINKDKHPLIKINGIEILNFQISFMIYMLLLAILMIVNIVYLTQTPYAAITIVLTWVLIAIVGLTNLITMIVGAVKAYDGKYLDFPLKINFISKGNPI